MLRAAKGIDRVHGGVGLFGRFRYRTVDASNELFVWPSMVVVAMKNDES